MLHLRPHDRAGLLAIVASTVPYPAVHRAYEGGGKFEVLGGFSPIPPGTFPGYIVRITSDHGTVYLIGVAQFPRSHKWFSMVVDEVPWDRWDGDKVTGEGYSNLRGDNPAEYAALKEEANEVAGTTPDVPR